MNDIVTLCHSSYYERYCDTVFCYINITLCLIAKQFIVMIQLIIMMQGYSRDTYYVTICFTVSKSTLSYVIFILSLVVISAEAVVH